MKKKKEKEEKKKKLQAIYSDELYRDAHIPHSSSPCTSEVAEQATCNVLST